MNSEYLKYLRLTLALHIMLKQGKGESAEADLLREEVLPTWARLTEHERERLNGLSADLYMLEGDEMHVHADPADRTRGRFGPRFKAAWGRQDWDEVLKLLRIGPDFLGQDVNAYLRGRCWQELGQPDVAFLFFDHAGKLNPQRVGYHVLALEELTKYGNPDEIVQRASIYMDQEDSHLAHLV